MKRAKKGKRKAKQKLQANALTTPGLGIVGGMLVASAVTKMVFEKMREAFGDPVVPDGENVAEYEIPAEMMFGAFDAFNTLFMGLVGGKHRKIVAIRPFQRTAKAYICIFQQRRRINP